MKIAIVLTHLPIHGIEARESLDFIFALAAVDHQVSVIFCGDAVYQLVKANDSSEVLTKDFRRSFKLFELYDIEQIYVCAESLKQRQLEAAEFVLDVLPLDITQLNQLLFTQQHVIKA